MRRHHQQHTQPQNTSQMNLISEEAIAIGQHNIKMRNQTKSSRTHVVMTHGKHRMFIKNNPQHKGKFIQTERLSTIPNAFFAKLFCHHLRGIKRFEKEFDVAV